MSRQVFFLKLHDGLINGHVPAKVTDPLLQSFGTQEIARPRMSPDEAHLDLTFRQLLLQTGKHARGGDIHQRRIGKIANNLGRGNRRART